MAGQQLLSSKVVVIEEEPRVRGISPAPTSVAAALGTTERGPIGQPVLVISFEEYEANFGGFTQESDVALAAMGFFQNGGGQLWVVRTVHYSDPSDPSTATAERARAELLRVVEEDPGDGSLTGDPEVVAVIEAVDPGAFGNQLEVEVRS
jgi:uncharacterized protein